MFSVSFNNNSSEQVIDNMKEFTQKLKEKKKKLDEKTKFKKALRGLKNNNAKSTSHGSKVHGLAEHKSGISSMYAMVLAIATQMNTNLKSMGVQAQHISMLDNNNANYNDQMVTLQQEASKITDYTGEDSLETSSDVSSKMNILGNNITANQEKESQDSAVAQGFQTNSGSDSSIGQSLLDMDKQIFRSQRFRG